MLGAGALAAQRAIAATGPALHFAALDHVAVAVSDPEKSVAFYSRIFGNTVLKDNKTSRRYLRLGPCYVAIAPPAQAQDGYRVDHICAGIAGYQGASVKGSLEQLGLPVRESNVGLFVADPDGISLQFFTENSWNELGRTASPEKVQAGGEAIFRPTGLDHVLLRVADPEKSAGFYEKLFGPVTQRSNSRIFFQVGRSRIGMAAVAEGKRAGVDHFCVSAPPFDYAAVTKKLEQAGAKVQPPEVAGWPEFHDPDGILVQVSAPRTETKK